MHSSKRAANSGPADSDTPASGDQDRPAAVSLPAAGGAERTTARAPRFVLTHAGELLGEDTAESRETVRRIHACVHACEGISTEELERGIVADMRRVLGQVVPVLETRIRG